MPDSGHFEPDAEPIYLGEAAYFWVTGTRHERKRVQRLISQVRMRAWIREANSIQPNRYTHWWRQIEAGANALVRAAQRQQVLIFGVLDDERVELPASFLSMTLYADPLHEVVRPEIDEDLGGDFDASGPIYKKVTFRFSQVQGLLAKQRGGLHTAEEARSAASRNVQPADTITPTGTEPPRGTTPRGRRRERFEQATALLQQEFPEGMPSRAQVPSGDLVERISSLVPKGVNPPSRSTILRAAGRRK